ncbi:MAG: formyltetrahydrofolate deformylase [Trueperaceae bacterium]
MPTDPSPGPRPEGRLRVVCPDRPGIVAAVSGLLAGWGANVTDSQQHSTDPEGGTFFMRMAFRPDDPSTGARSRLADAFGREVADRFAVRWSLDWSDDPPRVAVLASKADHALLELLWRHGAGELAMDLRFVASNHDRLRPLVERFEVPYLHLPIGSDGRRAQEDRLRAHLEAERVDLVVLARYMQILSPDLCRAMEHRIVNIHHSFLPAFVGADPYRQAWERGVKVIGATAHYVTEVLDQGPIIAQDVTHVDHRSSARDLARQGREIERRVLVRAVEAHLAGAIVVHDGRTIVFRT